VLFHDRRLSITNTVACASCHQARAWLRVAGTFQHRRDRRTAAAQCHGTGQRAKLQATSFYAPLFDDAFGTPEITGDRHPF